MAYYNNPYGAYQHANETKSHTEQIVACYFTAISYVQQAKKAHEEKDHALRYELVEKALGIMRGLQACLDFDANEEIANALNEYYESIERMLVAVQCEDNKSEICDSIVDNLRRIQKAWEQVNVISNDDGADNDDQMPPANDYEPQDFRV